MGKYKLCLERKNITLNNVYHSLYIVNMKIKLTCEETVRSEGNRRSSLPNLVGWLGYCVRQYSSRAHCDFSCRDSMCVTSDRPQASAMDGKRGMISTRRVYGYRCKLHTWLILSLCFFFWAVHLASTPECSHVGFRQITEHESLPRPLNTTTQHKRRGSMTKLGDYVMFT